MNKKILVIVTGLLAVWSAKSQAQGVVFVTQDAPYSHPEVLVHIPPAGQDNVIMQNTSFSENAENAQNSSTDENQNISYYVQKLNLSPEQIAQAQKISDKAHDEQEQILQSIENLRQQAHELEQRSLTDFEAILTDEQRNLFAQLRNERNGENIPENTQTYNNEIPQPESVAEVQPAEVTPEVQSSETQPEMVAEPQPEAPHNTQPEEIAPETPSSESQPEPVAEPQPESTPEFQPTEPQPEVQQETVAEEQPETISASQPEIQEETISEPQPETMP